MKKLLACLFLSIGFLFFGFFDSATAAFLRTPRTLPFTVNGVTYTDAVAQWKTPITGITETYYYFDNPDGLLVSAYANRTGYSYFGRNNGSPIHFLVDKYLVDGSVYSEGVVTTAPNTTLNQIWGSLPVVDFSTQVFSTIPLYGTVANSPEKLKPRIIAKTPIFTV
ncbi:MAG: hypothetical protein US16_C0062G0001 [Candidatus Moranbacteria bacterium GW2011_GWE2_36_40]|nr:MAG: hypothetical protein US16_C0062G0001 [Candidatus Moranbacteria bacterium GW2011_GWE2_36_40]